MSTFRWVFRSVFRSGYRSVFRGGNETAVPALALRDRAGDPILDRQGGYILTRV